MLLPVTMTSADPLLDTLWVPRQVIIDYHRADLEIYTLSSGFGGDHDLGFVPKVLNQGSTRVDGA